MRILPHAISDILEGEAYKKSFGTLNFISLLKTIYLHRKQLFLVAGFSINAKQSLQPEHDGLSNLPSCFPTLAVDKVTKIAMF